MVHKPAPFQRPSVDISKQSKKWQYVSASQISVGDIIRDCGKVVHKEFIPIEDKDYDAWGFEFLSGERRAWDTDVDIFAFTEG